MKRSTLFLLLLAICLVVPGTASAASHQAAVVDDDGILYQVYAGEYGDLFPKGNAATAETPVLALDITDAEGKTERLLVEETAGPELERAPAVVHEGASGALYLVWESQERSGSSLLLAEYRDGGWGSSILVSETLPLGGAPQLFVTRDSFTVLGDGEGAGVVVPRTVLHLTWWESSEGPFADRVLYAPVVLENGVFIGGNPVIALNDLDPEEPAVSPKSAGSWQAPAVEAGRDRSSLLVTFANNLTNRLVTVEVRLLPGEYGQLASEVSRHVVAEGKQLAGPGAVESLAGSVGGMIIEIGREFHPGIRNHLADQAGDALFEAAFSGTGPGIQLESLADAVGGMIIEIGARITGNDGLARTYLEDRLSLVRISREDPTGVAAPPLSEVTAPHLLRLYVASSVPVPDFGAGEPSVFVSETGARSLVFWQDGDELMYRETAEAEWTEVRHLTLGEGLDLRHAEEILRHRVRER